MRPQEHYEAIAQAIRKHHNNAPRSNNIEHRAAISDLIITAFKLADLFARHNLRFDRTGFLAMCGL